MSQNEVVVTFKQSGGSMKKHITVLGVDLAKNVFQLHGNNAQGQGILKKRLSRATLLPFVAQLPPCIIGIEACGSAHYWARKFQESGHTVKMMAPQLVKPYVMANKNDMNDARGIAEAVARPEMKFVSPKTIAQQDILLVHRARELCIKSRIAQSNQIRGLLAEYGITMAQGVTAMRNLPVILDINQDKLSEQAKHIFLRLFEQFNSYDNQAQGYEKNIEQQARQHPMGDALMRMPGIGPITASALIGTIGDVSCFKNGRELAAWLGLVPKQYSSGNKIRLGGISKRGDRYLRSLLIHGARASLRHVDKKEDRVNQWASSKKATKPMNLAAVALANKNVRMIWAIMSSGESYRYEVPKAA